jgi:hypothetical protein
VPGGRPYLVVPVPITASPLAPAVAVVLCYVVKNGDPSVLAWLERMFGHETDVRTVETGVATVVSGSLAVNKNRAGPWEAIFREYRHQLVIVGGPP